jgi:hypothetical protein
MRLDIPRLALFLSIGWPLTAPPSARAQAPVTPSPPIQYAPAYSPPGAGVSAPRRVFGRGVPLFGRVGVRTPNAGMPAGPGGTYGAGYPGLPRGRRYYNGRYFGSFNNRFYGPQYGNF